MTLADFFIPDDSRVVHLLGHIDSLDAQRVAEILSEKLQSRHEEWLSDLQQIFARLGNVEQPRSYGIVRVRAEE